MATPPATPASRRVIPIAVAAQGAPARTQRLRWVLQGGFFVLFILAPVFDLFRYDLNADHAWLLGMEWRLGLDPRGVEADPAGQHLLALYRVS